MRLTLFGLTGINTANPAYGRSLDIKTSPEYSDYKAQQVAALPEVTPKINGERALEVSFKYGTKVFKSLAKGMQRSSNWRIKSTGYVVEIMFGVKGKLLKYMTFNYLRNEQGKEKGKELNNRAVL